MTVAAASSVAANVTTTAVAGNSPDTGGAYITTSGVARSRDTSCVTRAYTAAIGGAASREAAATDPAAAATKMTTTASTSAAAAAALCKAGHACEQQYAQGDQHLLFRS